MENGKWEWKWEWVPCSYLHGAAAGKFSKTKGGLERTGSI